MMIHTDHIQKLVELRSQLEQAITAANSEAVAAAVDRSKYSALSCEIDKLLAGTHPDAIDVEKLAFDLARLQHWRLWCQFREQRSRACLERLTGVLKMLVCQWPRGLDSGCWSGFIQLNSAMQNAPVALRDLDALLGRIGETVGGTHIC